MSRWWRGLPGGWRVAMVIVAVVVALNLVLGGLGALIGHDPGGPRSSSYATAPDGLAGLARLYETDGHRVERLRKPLATAALDPSETLVVADPSAVLGRDSTAVARFVRAGGRVLALGRQTAPLLDELVGGRVRWRPTGALTVEVLAPVADAAGVSSVGTAGAGSWEAVGAALPFLGRGGTVLGVVAQVGRGRIVALADASPLQNARLGRADNAALGLAAVGGAGRVVAFDEASHGYGSGGPGVIPARWSRATWLALVAVLLLMWSVATRLGPPEQQARQLPPARREYVDALAVSLSRTREPAAAVVELQRRGRAHLTQRLGLQADAPRELVVAAAGRAGIAEEDVAPLFDTASRPDDVIDVGRAAARHRGGRSD